MTDRQSGGFISAKNFVPVNRANLGRFIINGPATSRSRPNFAGKLSEEDMQKLHAFILGMADAVRPQAPAAGR